MHPPLLRSGLAAFALTLALAGCGSNGDGDDDGGSGGSPPPAAGGSDVPSSAQQSVAGLVAYLRERIGATSDTSEPVFLGNAVLPTDETSEPLPVR